MGSVEIARLRVLIEKKLSKLLTCCIVNNGVEFLLLKICSVLYVCAAMGRERERELKEPTRQLGAKRRNVSTEQQGERRNAGAVS